MALRCKDNSTFLDDSVTCQMCLQCVHIGSSGCPSVAKHRPPAARGDARLARTDGGISVKATETQLEQRAATTGGQALV